MDRGLLAKALIIGFVCFIFAAGGLYYLSLMDERATRQTQEMTGRLSSNSDGIGAIGLLMLIIVGFFAQMIVAGAITAIVSSHYWDRLVDIFLTSALAGGTPVMLFWIIFWCLSLANIIGGVYSDESFGYSDIVFFVAAVLINVLTVGLGALLAGFSGLASCVLARGIFRGYG